MKKKSKKLQHITRVELSQAWLARLRDTKAACERRKYFYDKEYGNKNAALAAAAKWRDDVIRAYGIVTTYERNGAYGARKDKRTGEFVGVSPEFGPSGAIRAWRAGVRGEYYRFSVFQLGYEKAWRMAVIDRCKRTKRPLPDPFPDAPDADVIQKERLKTRQENKKTKTDKFR